jgi:hypothetical protein
MSSSAIENTYSFANTCMMRNKSSILEMLQTRVENATNAWIVLSHPLTNAGS